MNKTFVVDRLCHVQANLLKLSGGWRGSPARRAAGGRPERPGDGGRTRGSGWHRRQREIVVGRVRAGSRFLRPWWHDPRTEAPRGWKRTQGPNGLYGGWKPPPRSRGRSRGEDRPRTKCSPPSARGRRSSRERKDTHFGGEEKEAQSLAEADFAAPVLLLSCGRWKLQWPRRAGSAMRVFFASGRPGGTLGHRAHRPIDCAAAICLDFFADFGLTCPPVNRRSGHFARPRPLRDRNALRKCNGEFAFRALVLSLSHENK